MPRRLPITTFSFLPLHYNNNRMKGLLFHLALWSLLSPTLAQERTDDYGLLETLKFSPGTCLIFTAYGEQ